MTLAKIPTYYLLDSWAEAPASEGWQFVVDRLQDHNCDTSKKEVRQAVYERLVMIGIFSEGQGHSVREWKRAKHIWKTEYAGSLMR